MTRSYWERAWIVQEVAKANVVEIWCGDSHVVWKQAADHLVSNSVRLSLGPTNFGHMPRDETEVQLRLSTIMSPFETLNHFRTMNKAALDGSRRMLLFDALLWTRYTKASEPRDRVYSLLSLAADGAHLVPAPSYSNSTLALFADVARQMIMANDVAAVAMLILPCCKMSVDPMWPSWLPFWPGLRVTLAPWILDFVVQFRRGFVWLDRYVAKLADDLVLRICGQNMATIEAISQSTTAIDPICTDVQTAKTASNDSAAIEPFVESSAEQLHDLIDAMNSARRDYIHIRKINGSHKHRTGHAILLQYSSLLSGDASRARTCPTSLISRNLPELRQLSEWLIANRGLYIAGQTLATLHEFWHMVLAMDPSCPPSTKVDHYLCSTLASLLMSAPSSLASMTEHGMVLATTHAGDFLVVRATAEISDVIVWFSRPYIALVLRSLKSPASAHTAYSFVGEVCAQGCYQPSRLARHAPNDAPLEWFDIH